MQLSIYIHIPFCKSKCSYCDFYSVTDAEAIDRYLAALNREMQVHKSDSRLDGAQVETIYLGGGTPSLLNAAQISRILDDLSSAFPIVEDAEITIECNPDDLDQQRVEGYVEVGVNRMSLGVQSMHDSELNSLGRRHGVAEVVHAVELFDRAGLENFSIDLIYGVPGQSLDSWMESVSKALSLQPKHVSMYCLTAEAGTPLYESIRRGEIDLPSDEAVREMYLTGVDALESHDLKQYEISNFAADGHHSRHNCAYWTGKPYLGLGPSASSYIHPQRWKNILGLDAYLKGIEQSQRGVTDIEIIDPETARCEYLMLSLRLNSGVDLAEYGERFGHDLLCERETLIGHYTGSGLAELAQNRLCLTKEGMFVSDEIIRSLM
jgi:oxygen-independent coproporphyrinogen-3 oxidase